MITRHLVVLASLSSLIQAGYWPAFLDRAVLNIRQVVNAPDTETATLNTATETANTAVTPTATPTPANAAAATNTETAVTPTPAVNTPAAANPLTETGTATDTDTDTATPTPTPAKPAVAAAPPAAVNPAAVPAPPADANIPAASFSIPFDEQTGTLRYAPMPKKPGTKITVKDQTMLYPTSAYDIFMTNQPAGSVVQTYTQPATYASVVSREATVSVNYSGSVGMRLTVVQDIAAAPAPADANMQKFLNRWRD
jgi:hypothetical protein